MAESQKYIERNRAPRVQIAYEVERYGSSIKVDLPFIVGVMADLSGKPAEALPELGKRSFTEIDADNFNEVLSKSKPRVAFQVPNTLTGQGDLSLEMSFDKLEDFSPEAVARKVEPLRKLFEARTQLNNLLSYVDGKGDKAEELLLQVMENKDLAKSLMASGKPQS